MRNIFRFFAPVALFCLLAAGSPAAPVESERIDALLDKSRQQAKVAPNAPADEATFLRRVYLDVAGRIPTLAEAQAYLADRAPDRRSKLIDQLLASDGYALNFFNFWADILRVQSGYNQLSGPAYASFLRESLQKNQPYDEFVRALVAGHGVVWQNKAGNYYMRDKGMPLDNMANTVRIFLGTRLECAQCHNHPFDKWTQMDFYKMAAFSYTVDGTNGDRGEAYKNVAQAVNQDILLEKEEKRMVSAALAEIFRPMDNAAVMVNEKRALKLPHDYQYTDAKPKSSVSPAVIFGQPVVVKEGEPAVAAYARWMTSPENPRFTTVITNRLWKKLFGVALMEPLDEITDSSTNLNPELQKTLNSLMIAQKYDMKAFLRVLLHTKAYQAASHRQDYAMGAPWHFAGPLLRRMTAEQVWDSLVTLITINPDAADKKTRRQEEDKFAHAQKLADALLKHKEPELLVISMEVAGQMMQQSTRLKTLQGEIADARVKGEIERLKELRKEQGDLQRVIRTTIKEKMYEGMSLYDYEMEGMKPQEALAPEDKGELEQEIELLGLNKPVDPKERPEKTRKRVESFRSSRLGMSTTYLRASELASPAPNGHFVRQFGQSDRITIENANDEASVPQVLNLLNGKVIPAILNPWSTLRINLVSLTSETDKVRAVYQMLYARLPNEKEEKLGLEILQKTPQTGLEDLVSALINTQQFLFVQ